MRIALAQAALSWGLGANSRLTVERGLRLLLAPGQLFPELLELRFAGANLGVELRRGEIAKRREHLDCLRLELRVGGGLRDRFHQALEDLGRHALRRRHAA